MPREILIWQCKFIKCGFDNWVYTDDMNANPFLICENCGIGTAPKERLDKPWLPCAELTGLNLRLPNGNPEQGWIDGNNKTYTREDYIKTHYVDPERYYYFSHPTYERPDDLIPQPVPRDAPHKDASVPQDQVTPADLRIQAALKEVENFRDGKKITEMDYIRKRRYLEKLRDWRNLDLITDEDIDNQIAKMI
jgi:hypothetical protein